MVKRFVFAVPGDLATPTGGYAYDRRMIAELQRARLADRCPRSRRRLSLAGRQDARDRAGAAADGPAGRHHRRRWAGARRSAGGGAAAARRHRAGRAGAPSARAGVGPDRGPSRYSARQRARGAGGGQTRHRHQRRHRAAAQRRLRRRRPTRSPSRVRAAIAAPPAPGSPDGIVRLLSVGAIVPRKGFDVLIAALATHAALPWRLTIAGDRTRDPQAAAQLDADIARHELGRARHAARRGVARAPVAALRRGRLVRACLALRGLRHGLCRSDRARPAGDRQQGRRHSRHGAGRRRPAGRARRRRRLGAGARAASSAMPTNARRHDGGRASRRRAQLPSWRQSAEIFARALEALA